MSKIKVLPENLANKIAAGEVIERPAAVIKELIENAIDARAHSIFVSLVEGGARLMQVRDDGEGIGREDSLMAFQRHATSKIVKDADLGRITTLGFRGEALPSIASVSNIRLITRNAAEEEGSELILEAGVLKETRGMGAPVGSFFEVRDLFYNVPARKKFLKSVGTELSHIRHVVFFQALAHPEIQFQLTHSDKILLSTPAVSNRRDRLAQLYGDEALHDCIEARRVFSDMTLHLFVSKVPLQKGLLKDQILFINGRYVKNPIVARAVYDAYGTFMVKGDHPFYLLYLEVDPTQIDVNVHPTKKEVRFENSEIIYQAVKKGVHETLVGRSNIEEKEEQGRARTEVSFSDPSRKPRAVDMQSGTADATGPTKSPVQGHALSPMMEKPLMGTEPIRKEKSLFPDLVIRPIGQVYGTFLLAEVEGELVMVDQHTAHERILYEMLLAKDRSQASTAIQPLLIPRQVNLTPISATVIAEHLNLLSESGFMLEPFGETVFLIRAVPVALSAIDFESFLVDLSKDLGENLSGEIQPKLKIIASMACHGAVRAHQTLNKEQIEGLLRDYFNRNTPPTCPHGRPILIKYPLLELEKLFRRK